MRGGTLAQGGLFQAPEALEESGGLGAMVLEQPLIVAGAIIVIAVVAFLACNRNEKTRLGAAIAGGLLLAAGGVLAAGLMIETTRELVRSQSRALVVSTGSADAAGVAALLGGEVNLLMGGQRVPGVGREVILGTLERLDGRYALADARVTEMQAVVDGDARARTQVQVRARAEGGAPSLSWWLLHWTRNGAGEWRVTRIDCLLLNGRRPSPEWMP